MKAGAKYERFVYEKLRHLFSDANVTLNDRIVGRTSKLNREIDVSIRIGVNDTELLYIVQCKDWASPVDINTLGAFSAVMLDVGAAKGFLLCTSGFYATNHQYARSVGIELVTIEDIQSEKWSVKIEIPFVYVKMYYNYMMDIELMANEALVELNRDRELTVETNGKSLLRTIASAPAVSIEAYVLERVKEPLLNAKEGAHIDLARPGLEVLVLNVWVPCTHLIVILQTEKVYYLKYVTPTEYSQLRDHVRGITLPLHAIVEGLSIQLDESFVQMPKGSFASFPGLWFQVEEKSVIKHNE